MNRAETSRGPRWRWIWAFLFVFIAHVVSVFLFEERSILPAPPERPQPLFSIPADDDANERLLSLVAGVDPTLFSLPSLRGFSGDAWLTFTPGEVTLSNWTASPRWLPMRVEELGTALAVFAQTNIVSSDELLDQLRATPTFELRVPGTVIRTNSTFRIEGPLASRLDSRPQTLPVATNLDLLANTVVEIAVNGDGVVESVTLTSESGQKTMDQLAANVARALVFAPLPLARPAREAATPIRGRVVFAWHVVPPPLTNGVTALTPLP